MACGHCWSGRYLWWKNNLLEDLAKNPEAAEAYRKLSLEPTEIDQESVKLLDNFGLIDILKDNSVVLNERGNHVKADVLSEYYIRS